MSKPLNYNGANKRFNDVNMAWQPQLQTKQWGRPVRTSGQQLSHGTVTTHKCCANHPSGCLHAGKYLRRGQKYCFDCYIKPRSV